MRVPPGANYVHPLRPRAQSLHHLVRVQHLVADGVVDLIQHYQIVFAAVDSVAAGLPTVARHLDVLRVRLRASHFHEAAPPPPPPTPLPPPPSPPPPPPPPPAALP